MSDLIARAETAIELGQFEVAEEILRDALSSDPEDPNTWQTLARLKLQLGDYAEAKRLAEKVIGYNPDSPTAYLILGWATLQGAAPGLQADVSRWRQKLHDCHELVDRALELAPWAAHPFALKATLYQLEDRHDEALQQARAGLAVDPHFAPCALCACESLYALDRLGEAKELSGHHLAFDAESDSLHHQLALVEIKQDNYDAALLHARQALKLSPENTTYRQTFWDAVACQYPVLRLLVRWQQCSLKLQERLESVPLWPLFIAIPLAALGATIHIMWDVEAEGWAGLAAGLSIALLLTERPFQGVVDWWLIRQEDYRHMLDPAEVRNGLLVNLGVMLFIFCGIMLLGFENVVVPGAIAAIGLLIGVSYTLYQSSWAMRFALIVILAFIGGLMTYAVQGFRWHSQDTVKPLRYVYSMMGALFLCLIYVAVYLQSLDSDGGDAGDKE